MPTYTWAIAQSGTWSGGSFWTPAGPPTGDGNDALINAAGPPAYTVTYDEAASTIHSLFVESSNATLSFDPGDALTLDGGLTLTAGTIDVTAGAMLSADDPSFVGGRLDDNSGTIAFAGTLSLNSGALLTVENSGGTLTNHGFAIASGATAEINSGGVVTVSGALVVNGLLEATAGIGTISFSSIRGSGIVEANGATLDLTSLLSTGPTVSYDIADSALSVLRTDALINAGNTITFLGTAGEFAYTSNSPAAIRTTIAGLNAGSSATTPTNFVGLTDQGTVTITSGGTGTGSNGIVVLSNRDTLTLTGIQNGGSGWKVDTRPDASGTGTDIFLQSEVGVCYAAGTRILTTAGERMIETLSPGDSVITRQGEELEARPVKWLGWRRIDLASHPRPQTVAPIRIRRGAVADNVPHRDLLVSPDHAILIDGKLICARQLVNGSTIGQEMDHPSVTYFHVELEEHGILLAEGLPAESYLDTGNRGFFANAAAPVVLYPDLTDPNDLPSREAGSCAPLVSDEANVRPIWQRLADRAVARGEALPQSDATVDPDLRIVTKELGIAPLYAKDGYHLFMLPDATCEVRLVSRAGTPADTRPWLEDRRCLGVYVERIVLRDGSERREIPVDHPALSRGWWAVERDGIVPRRWTNGDALLPLPPSTGPVLLELHASTSTMQYAIGGGRERRAA